MVIFSLYAVLFPSCTEVKSLYAVPISCKAFSRYTRCFFHYARWLFHYTRCFFFHYIHGTSFSLDLKRGQLCMKVKMVATTRILKKLSLGHLTELFHRDNSLFQALCQCGRLKKRAGDERDLVEKEGTTGEPVSIVLKTSFWYTSSWYTL